MSFSIAKATHSSLSTWLILQQQVFTIQTYSLLACNIKAGESQHTDILVYLLVIYLELMFSCFRKTNLFTSISDKEPSLETW